MYREKIDSYIESKRDEILEDVKTLVRIDSQRTTALPGKPYGEGAARVLAAASGMMENYGLSVHNYENHVVAGDFGPGEKELDILAHLDVVPVTDEWTVTKPFEPLIADGRIYGRGTADDKGPAIAALYAIRAIRDLNLPLKKSVRLILGSDEECGSSDLDYYYGIEKEAPYTFTPDGDFPVINLEKARLEKAFRASFPVSEALPRILSIKAGDKVNVVPGKAQAVLRGLDETQLSKAMEAAAKKTSADYTIEKDGEDILVRVKAMAAHASTPEMGNNAITALLHLLTLLPMADSEGYRMLCALGKLFPHGDTCGEALGVKMEDDISGALTMNLGILNYREGHLEGDFDSRAPLCATDENLTEKIRKELGEIGIEMAEGKMRPAHYVPEDSPFVQLLLDSYERYTGIKGKPLAIGGGTYVHELERGVAFGCMTEEVDNHMHGDDEFMVIDTILMSAKIFADVIMKLCGED